MLNLRWIKNVVCYPALVVLTIYLWLCCLYYTFDLISAKLMPADLYQNALSVVTKHEKNKQIAIILTIQKKSDYENYELALDTVKCYAMHHGYQLHLLNLTAVSHWEMICNQTDVFFKRHCATIDFLERNIDTIDYVLYLDADMGVINPTHSIQEYFEKDRSVEIIFYDRYFNHEIMAGSYLIKNTRYARGFIKYWADYFYRLPKSFHGTDNGCIHQVFMELHFASNPRTAQKCYPLWEKSKNFDDLSLYTACTRYYLDFNRTVYCDGKVKLIRKGNWGFARDGWLTKTRWAPSDFIFHGWKVSKLGTEWEWPFAQRKFNLALCDPAMPYETNWRYKDEFRSTDFQIMKELKSKRFEVQQKYLNDIVAISKYIV